MSLKDKNIEEIFRTELEDLEIPVDNSMWNNISQGLTSKSVVTSTGSTTTKILTYLGLGTAAAAIGVAVGLYITSSDLNEGNNENNVQKDQVIASETVESTLPLKIEMNEDRSIVEEIVKPKIIENDPAISKEEQITQPRQIIVKSPKPDEDVVEDRRNNSWVNNFLTPTKRSSQGVTNVEENTIESPNEISIVTEIVQIPDTIIEVVDNNVIIASIAASPVGGYAPLEVSFAQPSEKGSVIWNFGDGSTSSESNPSHIFEEHGSYTVTLQIEDENGSIVEDYQVIEVEANSALVYIPNILTPNDDGQNDYLTIQGKHLETYQLVILSHNGELIFESKSITNSWDGTNQIGEKVIEGAYAVLISATGVDGKKYEHKGIVKVQY